MQLREPVFIDKDRDEADGTVSAGSKLSAEWGNTISDINKEQ